MNASFCPTGIGCEPGLRLGTLLKDIWGEVIAYSSLDGARRQDGRTVVTPSGRASRRRRRPPSKDRVECEARPHEMSGHDKLLHLRDGGGLLRDRVGRGGRRALPIARDKSELAERRFLRRAPEATPAEPRPEICEAIASAKRYFAGEETDFSGVRLDLATGPAQPANLRGRAADSWGRTTNTPRWRWRYVSSDKPVNLTNRQADVARAKT